jgi:hypothetical protein
MVMIEQLTNAYRAIDARRIDLDQRLIALPPDDMNGSDELMVELGAVPASRQATLCQIALTPSETLAELPLKASILLAMGEQDDLREIAQSLAQDILRLPED